MATQSSRFSGPRAGRDRRSLHGLIEHGRGRPASLIATSQTPWVEDSVRDLAWKVNPVTGRRELTPESPCGRQKWLDLLRRQSDFTGASRGAVDRAMRTLGLECVVRATRIRTTVPSPAGRHDGDLLNRDFPPHAGGAPSAAAPNLVWVTDFGYVRTWASFVYVAFALDEFA